MRTNTMNKLGCPVVAGCLVMAALWPCGQLLAQQQAQAAPNLQKVVDGLRAYAGQKPPGYPLLAQADTAKPSVNVAQDAKAGEADKKATPGDKDKIPDFHVRFVPSSVRSNTRVSFDGNGSLRSINADMSVNFQVLFDIGKVQLLMAKNIQVTKAVTDTQENLTAKSRIDDKTLFSWEKQRGPNRTQRSNFYLNIGFTPPETPIRKLVEISGTLDVVYAQGQTSEAVLKPFSKFEGKRVAFKDLPGQFVKFTRDDRHEGSHEQIRVEMPLSFRPYVAKITLYDEADQPLAYRYRTGGSDGSTEYVILSVDLPDKGQIYLELYSDVRTKQTPFTVKNIPLTKPKPIIKAQPGDVTVDLKLIPPDASDIPEKATGESEQLEQLDPVLE